MRIYTLAKELSERFSIKVKSSDLATEIRDTPEFSHLKDSIKSHASSVGDDVVANIYASYEKLHGPPGPSKEDLAESRREAEEQKRLETEQAGIAEQKRRDEIKLRRQQLEQQRQGQAEVKRVELEHARQRRDEEVSQRREALGRSPVPIPAPPPRPAPAAGGVPLPKPRIAPLPKIGAGVPAPPKPSPAKAAPPTSKKASPAPATAKVKAVSPAPSASAAAPPAAAPTARAKSAPMSPPVKRPDGQPAPPPPPKLSVESPFRMRPAAPPRSRTTKPSDRDQRGAPQRAGSRSDRPGNDRGRPGRGGKPGELVLPSIEAMSLKTPSRRGRGGGGGAGDKGRPTTPKRKGLKTIERSEIEFKPSKVYGLADEFRRPIGTQRRRPMGPGRGGGRGRREKSTAPKGPVTLHNMMSVAQFAEKLGVSAAEIVKRVFMMGQQLTINQLIDLDLAELIAQDYEIEIIREIEDQETEIEALLPEVIEANLKTRPPVVTIMGHVDHGKTTLLDAYRSSRIVESEAGGITQHIGAYRVDTPRGEIVFLDTPGHAAFTSMRARGAKVTDIVILVVSADDGVMPQTLEAINHAREADVPMIVAINKIDLPAANPERVRTELLQHSVLPEELGGDTIFVEVSAKEGTNLDQLLEMIQLQAEVLELTADPECRAQGTIIEAHLDRRRGAAATVLIHQGTLRAGDPFVVGDQSGRVRLMTDDLGNQIKEAGPSYPVEITGLSGAPDVGETFLALDTERQARDIAERNAHRKRTKELSLGYAPRHISLESLHDRVSEGTLKELKVVLKADVQGSLEAVSQSIVKLSNSEVVLRILHKATGSINESDVQLANASDAIIVGFSVRPDAAALALADIEGVEIKTYRIIYELLDEFEKAIIGMLDKRYKEVPEGKVEIRKVYKISRMGNIAGCYVLEGEITRNSLVRLVRDGTVVYEGKMESLRRVKDDTARVASGFECGIRLEKFDDFKEGDVVESYKMDEIPAELVAASVS